MGFFDIILNTLKNPNADDFWAAWGVLTGVLIAFLNAVFVFVRWFGNGRKAKIEKILTAALVENYLEWVRVKSSTQKAGIESLKVWLENGNISLLGYDYSVFKNFIKELNKKISDAIILPELIWFEARSDKYKSAPKWDRIEW